MPGLVPGIHAQTPSRTSIAVRSGGACGRMLRIRLGMAGTSPAVTDAGCIFVPPRGASDQFAHRHGGVCHPARKAPFVIVPRQHAHELAFHHLGLIEMEDRGMAVVARLATNLKSTTETLGVGTRIAEPSSLPFSSGSTRPTALAAPVVVGIIDREAARAR